MTETPAQRLGRYVRTRRRELKMTQADVQEAGGPSTATLRMIEGGKHSDFRDGTGAALESAIKWASGSIDATLAGAQPTPLEGQPLHRPLPAGSGGILDFWAENELANLPELRPLSPETVHRLLTTSNWARQVLTESVEAEPNEELVRSLIRAMEGVASAADYAAIESFGGTYAFLRSIPALKRYVEKGTGDAVETTSKSDAQEEGIEDKKTDDDRSADNVELGPDEGLDADIRIGLPELNVDSKGDKGKKSG